MRRIIQRLQYCFIATIGLVLAITAAGALSQSPRRDGYIGVVSQSVNHKPGAQFTFANIWSPKPFIVWPSGNGRETTKVFEDDEFIVLFFIASGTGATETFYLKKAALRFTLVEASFLATQGPSGEVQPTITHGSLK